MRLPAAALGVLVLVTRSSEAASYSTEFAFKAITDSGTVYEYSADQSHAAPITLPAAVLAEGWQCDRERVFLNNSGSGFVGLVTCTNTRSNSSVSSSVICAAKKPDDDTSGFNLNVQSQTGIRTTITFKLSCNTHLSKSTKGH